MGRCAADVASTEGDGTSHDATQPKEVNYKKYIGEREYVSFQLFTAFSIVNKVTLFG